MASYGIRMDVQQCYRNCPQYIHLREATFHDRRSLIPNSTRMTKRLDSDAIRLISEADTFFIATHGCGASAEDFRLGADVSHRGGNPGFVTVHENASRLSFPDYIGNFMFNTLGNLSRYPKCGLLFPPFRLAARRCKNNRTSDRRLGSGSCIRRTRRSTHGRYRYRRSHPHQRSRITCLATYRTGQRPSAIPYEYKRLLPRLSLATPVNIRNRPTDSPKSSSQGLSMRLIKLSLSICGLHPHL